MSGDNKALGDAVNKVMASGGPQTVTTKSGTVTITKSGSGVAVSLGKSVPWLGTVNVATVTGTVKDNPKQSGFTITNPKVSGLASASFPAGKPQSTGDVSIGMIRKNTGTKERPKYTDVMGIRFQNTTTLSLVKKQTYEANAWYGF
jgi:hypothetical protein